MMRVGTTAKMMAFVTRAPYNGNAAALLRYRTGLRMMSAAPPSAKVRRLFASQVLSKNIWCQEGFVAYRFYEFITFFSPNTL